MKVKSLFLIGLLVFLSACTGTNEPPPPGNYAIVPLTQTIENPDWSYCSGGDCWNGKLWIVTPTAEVFPTITEEFPVPSPLPTSSLPTLTPIGVLYVCPNGDYINVRQSPTTSSAILGQLSQGQRALVLTIYGDWTQIRYKTQVGYVYTQYVHNCVDGVLQ